MAGTCPGQAAPRISARYYRLEGAVPGSSDLSGRFDRDGFEP